MRPAFRSKAWEKIAILSVVLVGASPLIAALKIACRHRLHLITFVLG